MIRIELDSDTSEYELVEFQMAERTSCVVDPSQSSSTMESTGTVCAGLGSRAWYDNRSTR